MADSESHYAFDDGPDDEQSIISVCRQLQTKRKILLGRNAAAIELSLAIVY